MLVSCIELWYQETKSCFSQVDLGAQIEDLQDKETCSFSYKLELDALCLVFKSGHILLLDPLDTFVEEVNLWVNLQAFAMLCKICSCLCMCSDV